MVDCGFGLLLCGTLFASSETIILFGRIVYYLVHACRLYDGAGQTKMDSSQSEDVELRHCCTHICHPSITCTCMLSSILEEALPLIYLSI